MEQITEEKLTAALSPSPKRVILEHTNGPYAGLRQIIGWTAGDQELQPYEENIVLTPSTRRGDASLIGVFRRHILYREVKLQSDGQHFPIRVR